MPPKNLLLTGVPGVGKTTVLRKVASRLEERPLRGFLTDEIRAGGKRVGFNIHTLDGRESTLSHIDISSPSRVGRYGVDVSALDEVVDTTLRAGPEGTIFIVDEIGKMECFSTRFIQAISAILDSQHAVIATVARKGGGFIARVKQRPDVTIWEVTHKNRNELPNVIINWVKGL
jgi:nucleoside-triphosphatase